MARIFLSLSVVAIVLILANLTLGLTMGDFNAAALRYYNAQRELRTTQQSGEPSAVALAVAERDQARAQFVPIRRRASLHTLLGLGAALVSVLVNSITVTYFIGTNRWCREVSDAYRLDPSLVQRSQQLKRTAFPWSVIGILTTIAIVALGAASDPSANQIQQAGKWVSAHFIASAMGTAIIAWAFLKQMIAVGANYEVIQEILQLANEIRRQKGLT